jgi:hypothetical protein
VETMTFLFNLGCIGQSFAQQAILPGHMTLMHVNVDNKDVNNSNINDNKILFAMYWLKVGSFRSEKKNQIMK